MSERVPLWIRLRVAAGALRVGYRMEQKFYTDLAADIEEAALRLEREHTASDQ